MLRNNEVDVIFSFVLIFLVGATLLLLGGCTTERMTGTKPGAGPVPGYKQEGSIGWNWNQIPHGGSDEKSSATPAEPTD